MSSFNAKVMVKLELPVPNGRQIAIRISGEKPVVAFYVANDPSPWIGVGQMLLY